MPRVRSNPFGAARPREEVLKEKTASQPSPPPTEVGETKQEEPAQGVKVELDAAEESHPSSTEIAEKAPAVADEPEAINAEDNR